MTTENTPPQTGLPQTDSDSRVLSGRIVAIVFWAMAVLGLLSMAVVLGGLRDTIENERKASISLFNISIAAELGRADRAQLERTARMLLTRHDLHGVEIDMDSRKFHVGQMLYTDTVSSQTLGFNDVAGLPSVARLAVYDQPVSQRLDERRKHAVLALGISLLSFGLILNFILRLVLCRPFASMIGTARAFAAGERGQRFNEQRADEFGFLATFINRALDTADRRTRELEGVVQRAQASESALALEKELLQVTLHSIGDGVITTDHDGHIEYLNPVALSLTGWAPADAVGRPIEEVLRLVHEDTNDPIDHPARESLMMGRMAEAHEKAMLRARDGRLIHVTVSAAPIGGERVGSDAHGVVCIIYDTTHERILARELTWQAAHDELTGLANRREFEQVLQDFVEATKLNNTVSGALLYLDMDHFKIVNDTHGHAAGDEMLRQFGQLLRSTVRDTDLVARLGGDEFGILLRGCNEERAAQVADSMLARVRQHAFRWDKTEFEIGLSIGLVAISSEVGSGAEALRNADVACYCAKEAGRNTVHEYHKNDEPLRSRERQMDWASRVRAVLHNDALVLYCQPIARNTSIRPTVEHHEILLRTHDEHGAIVPPAEFIAAAEKYHMMPEVDRWVVRTTLARLHATPAPLPVVAINLSGQTLSRRESLHSIVQEITASSVPPEKLIFEITETAAIANLSNAKRLIQVLRGMGCRFALDDFGSGMSSLAYIRDLDISFIKIDGHFVRNLNESGVDRALVEAAHRIGEVLGIETVGEWAENPDIIASLRTVGVHYAQGYGIAKPFPFEELCGATTEQIQPLRSGARSTR
jgi:diguanylate cyclase (GGDEF)-like protein/PAS domain S-box-containing protein